MDNVQAQVNGKWVKAKEIPYQQNWLGKIACILGYHHLKQSKKYVHSKFCFYCGKRKYNKKFDY